MMRVRPVVLLFVLLAGGCAGRNFVLYKDGNSFYLTSDCARRKQVLCDSGDFDRVVADSKLTAQVREELKTGVCGAGGGREAVLALLGRMSGAEYSAFLDAFRRNGYEINKVADS